MTLLLPRRCHERIATDASSRYPIEACGILIGDRESGRHTVREVRVEPNSHGGSRRRRFAIAPEALLRAEKEARAAGLEVVGYYHSHPDAAAAPSKRDLEAAWPEVSYLRARKAGRSDEHSDRQTGGGRAHGRPVMAGTHHSRTDTKPESANTAGHSGTSDGGADNPSRSRHRAAADRLSVMFTVRNIRITGPCAARTDLPPFRGYTTADLPAFSGLLNG